MDGRGNYTLGIQEQIIFTEINIDNITKILGMNITDVYKRQVEPKTQKDLDKLVMGLAKLAEEDPTFTVQTNEETGQTVISGMGELHFCLLYTSRCV